MSGQAARIDLPDCFVFGISRLAMYKEGTE
jgi:hypothetical protein